MTDADLVAKIETCLTDPAMKKKLAEAGAKVELK